MTYPTAAVNTANVGASGDSPALARSDILDGIQKLNQMIAHTTAFAATLLDDANAAAARATLGAAASGTNADITSMTGLLNGGIPLAKVSGAAASGANADIASLDGVHVGKGAGGISTNTRYGAAALGANTTGSSNTAIGANAGAAITTASSTTLIGANAGAAITTASSTTLIGANAGASLTGSGANTVVGANALSTAGSATGNVVVGNSALPLATSGWNIGIGPVALKDLTTGSGNIMIGSYYGGFYSAVFNPTTESTRLCMGHYDITNAYVKVAWTVVSDARDKTSFAQVPHGLSFVNALKPTAYQYTKSRDDMVPTGPVRYGFKAQDVLALEGDNPVIIDNEDPEKLRMVDQHLIAVLVNAVQELSATVTAQAARIEALEAA